MDLHALIPWALAPFFIGSASAEALTLSSPAFPNQAAVPARYAYHGVGENQSIPYDWKNPPKGTKSFALVLFDPHPVAKNWIHWAVTDIPPATMGIPEGASGTARMPGKEKTNSFGEKGYGGPMPPPGSGVHPYRATLYALSVPSLSLPEKPSLRDFEQAVKGHVLASANYEGTYERK